MADDLAFDNNMTYLFKVDTVTHVSSSVKGTPGLQVSYVCSAGENEGTRLIDTIWLTSNNDWKVSGFLDATGVQGLPQNKDDISLYKAFHGKEIMAVVAVQAGGENSKTGTKYKDRNVIRRFVGSTKTVAAGKEENNSNLPF